MALHLVLSDSVYLIQRGACLQNPTSIYMPLSKYYMYTQPRARYHKRQMTNSVAQPQSTKTVLLI